MSPDLRTSDPAAILIIRRDNIGDLLCTTPMIAELRRRFPAARIDALVNSYNAPILHGNPHLDNVYFYTKAKHRAVGETALGVYWRRLRLMLALRQVGYDQVYLAGDGNVERQMGLARWLKPRRIIGSAPTTGKAPARLDTPIPRLQVGHEVERSWSLLAPLGTSGPPPAMVLRAAPGERAAILAQLQAQSWYRQERPVIAVHISARKIPQRWPVASFADLLHRLAASHDLQFMLFWSPGDESNPLHPGDDAKAAQLVAACPGLPLLPCPTHGLAQLVAALDVCAAMICADGGAMHVAAALGKPIVCLFGNSDAARWYPWGVPHVVVQKESRDVRDIAVDEVFAAFASLRRECGF